jgi:iron complex transport system substrate-binding protein
MKRRPLPYGLAAAGVTVVLLTAACGAQVETSAAPPGSGTAPVGPVTVKNCGKDVTYDKVPERAVTNNLAMTEQMFALGLADRMRGYVVSDVLLPSIESSAYKTDFAKVERLSDDRIGLETVLSSGGDWVYAGWNNGFVESRGITPEILAKNGVASYIMSETCGENGGQAFKPVDALYDDFRNLGKIFGVPDRAERAIAEVEKGFANAAKDAPATKPRVLLFYESQDKPWLPGANSMATPIVEKAGGKNITDDIVGPPWAAVGWETIVARDPEVVFIYVYDYATEYEKLKGQFLSNPSTRDLTAVKKGNIFPIEYADTTLGPRAGTAAEKMAKTLKSINR